MKFRLVIGEGFMIGIFINSKLAKQFHIIIFLINKSTLQMSTSEGTEIAY